MVFFPLLFAAFLALFFWAFLGDTLFRPANLTRLIIANSSGRLCEGFLAFFLSRKLIPGKSSKSSRKKLRNGHSAALTTRKKNSPSIPQFPSILLYVMTTVNIPSEAVMICLLDKCYFTLVTFLARHIADRIFARFFFEN